MQISPRTLHRILAILVQMDDADGYCLACDRLSHGRFEAAIATRCPLCHEDAVFGEDALRTMTEPNN